MVFVKYVCGIFLILFICPSFAAKEPKSLSSDYRMRQVIYDPNQIVHIDGVYGYQTAIEFSTDELIKVVTLGDSVAWQTVPYLNRLFIKPVEDEATTNMTVITNKRTYYFQLDGKDKASAVSFLIRFVYPNQVDEFRDQNKVNSIEEKLALMNWHYSTSGDKDLFGIKKIFDDGQFTYFLFDENKDIPAIYAVDSEGYEAIVNTRREGKYIVVERTNNKFTLRNGQSYLCIRNNALLSQYGDHDD